jgi:hypothetical protein
MRESRDRKQEEQQKLCRETGEQKQRALTSAPVLDINTSVTGSLRGLAAGQGQGQVKQGEIG